MKGVKSWNAQLATTWTKMVGPSRPTCSELTVYLKYIRILQNQKKRKLKMLVLGSTPEFRDLGFEEAMDVTVIDCNTDYHNQINREIRHKITFNREHILVKRWQDLNVQGQYDIILGDLVTGNIPPSELETFISNASNAMTPGGYFLGKSFYQLADYTLKTPTEIITNYNANPAYHPYSAMIYHFSILCLENDELHFNKMFQVIRELHDSGLMDDETFWYFRNIGLDNEMDFTFYIPSFEYYTSLIKKYFTISNIEYGNDVYSKYFPLVIAKK